MEKTASTALDWSSGTDRKLIAARLEAHSYDLARTLLRARREDKPGLIEGIAPRAGWEAGLVRNNAEWDQFHEMRNVTAHPYDAEKAAAIFLGLHEFIEAVSHMLTAAETREHAS